MKMVVGERRRMLLVQRMWHTHLGQMWRELGRSQSAGRGRYGEVSSMAQAENKYYIDFILGTPFHTYRLRLLVLLQWDSLPSEEEERAGDTGRSPTTFPSLL